MATVAAPGRTLPLPIREVPRRLDVSTRLGLRVRRLRTERDLTQTRMSEVFGIDRTFLSELECGRKSISLPTLEILALGFKLSLSELLKDL